jgi:superfamily I DNA/RNA helicase
MAMVKKATRVWSPQQKAIFKAIRRKDTRPILVRARAGTGKTTTIVKAADESPYNSVAFFAFNRKIAAELRSRTSADVRTLHSVGMMLVKRMWPNVEIADPPRLRAEGLTMDVCGPSVPVPVRKLITRLHTYAREAAPLARTMGDLTEMLLDQECEPDPQWADQGYDNEYIEGKALEAMVRAADREVALIDFADQIFLPVRNAWVTPLWDDVFVDEAQDMTMAQLIIAQGVARHRINIVGDDRQAIYGFRGADSNALDRLKKELNAEEYPLTATYRCGHAIVDLAKRLVPDFEAAPGQILETTATKLLDEIKPGDFLLSRVNAPLATTAMALLRRNIRARITGKDIGTGLKALVWKMRASSIEDLMRKVKDWEAKEVARLTDAGREHRVPGILDKTETLIALCDGAEAVTDVESRIDYLFSESLPSDAVVTCSSVHRSKGLEANRVFVLRDTLRDYDEEEINIQYVAITRAIHTLVWVYGGVDARPKNRKQAR